MKYLSLLLVILLLIPSVTGHGSEEPTETEEDENNDEEGLSLEILLGLTVLIGMVFLVILGKLVDLDPKILTKMLTFGIIFLLTDYLYLKFVLYG